MDTLLTSIVGLITLTAVIGYFYVKNAYSYWSKRGVQTLPVVFPFGNFKSSFKQEVCVAKQMELFYRQTVGDYLGVYGALRPMLLIRDPELIRNVMVKDFNHFRDRGFFSNEKIDPLTGNLFLTSGDKWRHLRTKLSPSFTSGKLKAMFSTLNESSCPLYEYISKKVSNNELIDVRDLSARYATNVIASVAFGIDINCIENPNTDFRRYGKKVFEPTLKNGFRNFLTLVSPTIMETFKIRSFDKDVYEFTRSMVEENLEHREKNHIVRKDFFQLLMQLRNTGTVESDDQWTVEYSKNSDEKKFTLDEVTAQAFVFWLAGFETSSSTMSFCLYEISKHPEIQRKAQAEIDEVLARNCGQLSYDSINDMKYLEACIDETLRKYPPVPVLNRVCNKAYTVPGTNFVIDEGVGIIIPAFAIHYDEQYYPEPNKFDPERFNEENKKSFVEMPYMPFGDGPRFCIGMRLGKLQTKMGLVAMLRKFNFNIANENLKEDLTFSPQSFLLLPNQNLELKVSYR